MSSGAKKSGTKLTSSGNLFSEGLLAREPVSALTCFSTDQFQH